MNFYFYPEAEPELFQACITNVIYFSFMNGQNVFPQPGHKNRVLVTAAKTKQTRKMSIRSGDAINEGIGGRNSTAKRNPEMRSLPVVYGPGVSFQKPAIYPGRI